MRPITFSLFFCCVPPVSSQYWLYSFADTDWELEARHRIRWYGSEDGFEESQLTCLREKTWWSRSCSLSNSVYQRSEEVTFSSYFPVPPSAEIPSSSLTFVFLSSGVFEEKNIENFIEQDCILYIECSLIAIEITVECSNTIVEAEQLDRAV